MSELAGEKIDIIDWSEDPATFVGNALSPSKVVSVTVLDARSQDRAGGRAGLPALAGHRQGGPERPAGRPADRVADRHPQRRRPARRPATRAAAGTAVDAAGRPTPRRSRSAERRHGARADRRDAALHSEAALNSGSAPARPTPATALAPIGGTGSDVCRDAGPGRSADGLLRVVVVHGVLTPDPRRRLPGRGAWLHPAPECLDRAERRSAFPRALRVPGPLDTAAVRAHIAAAIRSSTARGIRETPGSVTPGSKVDPS